MPQVGQRPVALILARELAENIATPMLVWDSDGAVVYFNEPAAEIMGRSFDDMRELSVEDLGQFGAEDLDGTPIDPSELPSVVATRHRRASHRVMCVTALDGQRRTISVAAFPLFVRGDRFVGAMAVFWQLPEEA